jgi:hypothetical protein
LSGSLSFAEVVGILGYAAGQELPVVITTDDGTEVTAVPSSVDPGLGALEVVLRLGPDDDEVVMPLARIHTVRLV